MKLRKPPKDPSKLWRLPYLLAQVIGLGVDVAYLRRCQPLRRSQQLPQGELEVELVVGALGALRQHCNERQPCPEGGDGFGIRIAPCRILSCLLPIMHGPPDLTAALEVDSQPGRDLPRL